MHITNQTERLKNAHAHVKDIEDQLLVCHPNYRPNVINQLVEWLQVAQDAEAKLAAGVSGID